ncbi:DNA polymerase-3 subunit alpha [Desulfitispora alkaliphila]|uniref:DNA polymerase III subunit alpha n=1 Tax=Desulfitispora alkaliphila TaxID=622674 RepID=UPI003D1994E6
MSAEFVHLHNHTEFSLLDGSARIKALVEAAVNNNMPAIAITDHGVMYGVIDFYKAAVERGIKPIIGCEVYVAPRTRFDKEPRKDENQFHLVLLAKNKTGYENLLKLVSAGFTEGFYYKPRVDKEILKKYSEGLIALSGCMAGEISRLILNDNLKEAEELAKFYNQVYGQENFYLELQDHGIEGQQLINRHLLEMSKRLGIPTVATNDVHYIKRKEQEIHDVLLCIQTGKTLADENRMRFGTSEFYLKTREEMELLFGEYREALDNSLKIAEKCNLQLNFDEFHLPYYEIPKEHSVDSYLRKMCFDRAKSCYKQIEGKVRERLDYELKVIKDMGYSDYFLIVQDFVNYAKEKGILVGPGRGSAAGSIVAYVLGITNIDPLKYNLLFERFLNPERVSMPDIDIDFCFERRGEVIDYVVNKYGSDKVAQIITFGTMAARAAVRDVGRVMNVPLPQVDKVAKMIPNELGVTIEKALKVNRELVDACEVDAQIKKLIENARALEGIQRHASTHAAGIVISKEELTRYVPLQRTADDFVVTQYAKDQVEDIGLLKMDILGLRTLTVIGNALKIIKKVHGKEIDIEEISLDDKATYDLLSRANTAGVFQLESSGLRAILKELKPSHLEDIIALVALYRPGPLGSGMVDDFIARKHGKKEASYLHPKLEPILKETYGVILYQEQVMKIANDLAGFTLGQADMLRRSMGKKKPEIIAEAKKDFIEGAKSKEIDLQIAEKIFELIEHFAGYGFNKSHSAAYALIAYQTAYLKAHYPVEYMASLLTSVMEHSDKVSFYIRVCQQMGIDILPPDVNESLEDFTAAKGKIRFGLAAVKNVGRGAIKSIIKARNELGRFTSLQDFCEKVDLSQINKRMIESLIRCGAFDFTQMYRSRLLNISDQAVELGLKLSADRNSGQVNLFDIVDDTKESLTAEVKPPELDEFSNRELLAMEKEMLGFYVSGHPLDEYVNDLAKVRNCNNEELTSKHDDQRVILGGIITALRYTITKKGEQMSYLTLEDLTGSTDVLVFPKTLTKYRNQLQEDGVIILEGRVHHEDDNVKIFAEKITNIKECSNELKSREIYIKIEDRENTEQTLQKLKHMFKSSIGNTPIYLHWPETKKTILCDNRVNFNQELVEEIKSICGQENVYIKEI